MGDVRVQKYQLLFPGLTKKLFESNLKVYNAAVIDIRVHELRDKLAYMSKIGKATKNGTRMTFVTVNTPEEFVKKADEVIADGEKMGFTFEVKEEE